MSTMSELDRLTKQIKQDELDILADIAYEQEQAMRESMTDTEEPQANENSLPDGIPF